MRDGLQLHNPGDLSPVVEPAWVSQTPWPIKPDIVLEGGNPGSLLTKQIRHRHTEWIQTMPDNTVQPTNVHNNDYDECRHCPNDAHGHHDHGRYPVSGPRPSATCSSTQPMDTTDAKRDRWAGISRRQRAAYIHRYGFGVPTADRALRSATDALTLVVQDTIHPFERGALQEMHLHDLPWPREELADLGEVPVKIRVTLSYFIEPSPTAQRRSIPIPLCLSPAPVRPSGARRDQ